MEKIENSKSYLERLSEEELTARFNEGMLKTPNRSLIEIHTMYYNTIKRFVFNNSGDIENAKDLFQECMIILFNKYSKGEVVEGKFGRYLYGIGRNFWLQKLRERKKNQEKVISIIDIEQYKDMTIDVDKVEDTDSIREKRLFFVHKHLKKLSSDCQEIIPKDLKVDEILKKFDVSDKNGAYVKKSRCFESLRKRINKDEKYKNLKTDGRV